VTAQLLGSPRDRAHEVSGRLRRYRQAIKNATS